MSTKEKILKILTDQKETRPVDLTYALKISSRAIRKQLRNLLNENLLEKIGTPPKVYYRVMLKKEETPEILVPSKIQKEINHRFLTITAKGEMIEGFPGFINWCKQRHLDIRKTADEYSTMLKKYDKYKVSGMIDGLRKFKETFSKIYLDKVYYLDFYSIERFGKTKLGQLLLYAKQSQDRKLIMSIVEIVRGKILKVIKLHNIEALAFIPPTVKREIQFMKEFEKGLNLNESIISINKIRTRIIIPQKTLNKLSERIINAKETFVAGAGKKFRNILLIDDAIGSGATLNEIARKIKEKDLVSGKIVGLSLTGSFKGFDVISEV